MLKVSIFRGVNGTGKTTLYYKMQEEKINLG
ncbi:MULTISPECIES: phosphoenolpyruvate carboxykinase (ATP) [unclassified Campylobacter]|nr:MULTISPECIES: phosphoenolpyruvate carboxykinase (ATP) [unclassified Campylobacter]